VNQKETGPPSGGLSEHLSKLQGGISGAKIGRMERGTIYQCSVGLQNDYRKGDNQKKVRGWDH